MNLAPQTPPHPSGDKRFKLLDVAIKRHQFRQDALIEILHTAQELFGYLDDDVLIYVGRARAGAALARLRGRHLLQLLLAEAARASTPASCASAPPAT